MKKPALKRLNPRDSVKRNSMRPKAHTFRGNRYKIVWHKPKRGKLDPMNRERWGTCSRPTAKGKRIMVWPRLKDLNLLTTLLDESIHACAWDLDNDSVDEISGDIARFLWRNGLRFKGTTPAGQ